MLFAINAKSSTFFITLLFFSSINAMERKKDIDNKAIKVEEQKKTILAPKDLERQNDIQQNKNLTKFHCCGAINQDHPFYKAIKRLSSLTHGDAKSPNGEYQAINGCAPSGVYFYDQQTRFIRNSHESCPYIVWNPQNNHEFWTYNHWGIYQYEVQDPRVKCSYQNLDGRYQYVADDQPLPNHDEIMRVFKEKIEERELDIADFRIKMAVQYDQDYLKPSDSAIRAKINSLISKKAYKELVKDRAALCVRMAHKIFRKIYTQELKEHQTLSIPDALADYDARETAIKDPDVQKYIRSTNQMLQAKIDELLARNPLHHEIRINNPVSHEIIPILQSLKLDKAQHHNW